MNTFRRTALIAILGSSALTACATDPHEKGEDSLPRTCLGLQNHLSTVPDGAYTLYLDANPSAPWIAYCVGAGTSNLRDYLVLPAITETANESGVFLAKDKDAQITTFALIAIDSMTMTLDTTDLSYVRLSGTTPSQFGTAIAGGNAAWAHIDLQGTPFAVQKDQFEIGGAASVTTSARDQVVEIEASGDGFVMPRNARLALDYIGTAAPVDEAAADQAGIELVDSAPAE